ncbi:hypothetical protein D7X48_21690 [bacterium D16-50]|nr:hypothetical protein D7X48_21690 [bacterium D16-50]
MLIPCPFSFSKEDLGQINCNCWIDKDVVSINGDLKIRKLDKRWDQGAAGLKTGGKTKCFIS